VSWLLEGDRSWRSVRFSSPGHAVGSRVTTCVVDLLEKALPYVLPIALTAAAARISPVLVGAHETLAR
jgi:hypothetical protein